MATTQLYKSLGFPSLLWHQCRKLAPLILADQDRDEEEVRSTMTAECSKPVVTTDRCSVMEKGSELIVESALEKCYESAVSMMSLSDVTIDMACLC